MRDRALSLKPVKLPLLYILNDAGLLLVAVGHGVVYVGCEAIAPWRRLKVGDRCCSYDHFA